MFAIAFDLDINALSKNYGAIKLTFNIIPHGPHAMRYFRFISHLLCLFLSLCVIFASA
mgnify:CR=1 FL=1